MLQVSRACRVNNPHLLFTLDQDTNDQLCRNRKEWPRPIPRNRNRQSIQVHLRDRGASVPQIPQASSGSSWYDLGLRCRRWLNFWGCLFLAYLSQCPFPLQSVPRIKSGLFEEILYFQTFRCVWLEYTGYAFLWIRFLRMDRLWAWDVLQLSSGFCHLVSDLECRWDCISCLWQPCKGLLLPVKKVKNLVGIPWLEFGWAARSPQSSTGLIWLSRVLTTTHSGSWLNSLLVHGKQSSRSTQMWRIWK